MTKKLQDDDGARVFADGRNVSAGRGRILWGTATETSQKKIVGEGWVLPGGQRTRDPDVARAWARWIDDQCRAWGR
jgi:hypothetical protein